MKRKAHLILALVLAAAIAAVPAQATSLSLYGSNWNTDQADDAFGGGIDLAFPIAPTGALDLELRASYYQELSAEPIDALFDDDDPVFVEDGLEAVPLELGLRYNFNPEGAANLYLAGGGGYYLLDTDAGEIDDEFGYYGALGGEFGRNRRGPSFFVEGNYRKVEGSVRIDPDRLDQIDDLEFTDQVDVDLDGAGLNLGLVWRW